MSIQIGKAKFGGDFVKRKYWKLKDGESTFRILPPLGSLANEGRWSMFYNVHYGYKNTKGQMRVFQSPLVKNRKTKMVEVPDAALERIETLRAKQSEAKGRGDETTAKKIGDLLQQYNLDNNHYVNAIDEQGNIGILKLRHRAKLALDATIKSLRDSGVEPLDADSGRFFVFRRSGNGLETTFQVGVKQRELTIDGVGKVKQDIVHVLTDEIITRLSKEAAELDKLYKRPTAEQVAQIVKTSDLLTGKSSAIDDLFDAKKDSGSGGTNDEGAEEEYGEDASGSGASQAQAASAPTTDTTFTQSIATPTVTQQAAAATAPTSTATVVTPTQSLSAAPKTTAQTVAEMSDADFLASLK